MIRRMLQVTVLVLQIYMSCLEYSLIVSYKLSSLIFRLISCCLVTPDFNNILFAFQVSQELKMYLKPRPKC